METTAAERLKDMEKNFESDGDDAKSGAGSSYTSFAGLPHTPDPMKKSKKRPAPKKQASSRKKKPTDVSIYR